MSKSPEQIQVFYNVSLEVGRSLNLREMLRFALTSYLKELDCVAGIVYRIHPAKKTGSYTDMIFAIPSNLEVSSKYQEIGKLVPDFFPIADLISFREKLPVHGHCNGQQVFHILSLGIFGFLVLIKNGDYLDDKVIGILKDINLKLTQSCIACIENDILRKNELRYRQQQELLSEIALELNSVDEFEKRINAILRKIGIHSNVSRVYIFEDSEDGLSTCNTFEWCNEGVLPQIDHLQDIPYDLIPSWKKILFEKGCVFSEDISELP